MDAWDRSRFLFRPEVFQELERLRRQAHDLRYQQAMQEARDDEEGRTRHVKEELNLIVDFGNTTERLSTIFGDELNLSIHHTVHGPLPSDDDAA